MPYDLSIIIVNWNGGSLLTRCVETIVTSAPQTTYEIVVVDNASEDDSLDQLRASEITAPLIAISLGIGRESLVKFDRKAIVAPVTVQPVIRTSSARPVVTNFLLCASKPTSFHIRRLSGCRFSSTISASEKARPAVGFW